MILQRGCRLESESLVNIRIAPIPTDSESCREWGLEWGLSESSPGNPEAAGVGDKRSEPTHSVANHLLPSCPAAHMGDANSRRQPSLQRERKSLLNPRISDNSGVHVSAGPPRAVNLRRPAAWSTCCSHTSVALCCQSPPRSIVSRATSLRRS